VVSGDDQHCIGQIRGKLLELLIEQHDVRFRALAVTDKRNSAAQRSFSSKTHPMLSNTQRTTFL
jgi:hypothetical protein